MDWLPNWLEVALALASLSTGSYAGAQVGALAHFRVARRLTILDDALPILLRGPPTDAQAAVEWRRAWLSAGIAFDMLPFLERRAWKRVSSDLLPDRYLKSIAVAHEGNIDQRRIELTRHAARLENPSNYSSLLKGVDGLERLMLRPRIFPLLRTGRAWGHVLFGDIRLLADGLWAMGWQLLPWHKKPNIVQRKVQAILT